MSLLLSEAAKIAKGTQELFHVNLSDGKAERCLWGEACSLVGVEDLILNGQTGLPTASRLAPENRFDIHGFEDWDAGRKDLAVTNASARYRKKTVGDFRRFLRKVDWL